MKQRHFSMLRDFQLADWFTLANAFCGTGAIFAAMRFLQDGGVRDLLWGMALIPAGVRLRCARRAHRALAQRSPPRSGANSIRSPT